MRRLTVGLVVVWAFAGMALVSGVVPAGAAANSWGCSALNGSSTPSGGGFWLFRANGGVSAYGDARWYGAASGLRLHAPIVGGAVTPSGNGYWLVAQDGGIFSYGDAKFYGSMGSRHLNQPIVSMAATKSGHGYWLVARDGGIFTFGDAKFHGSTGSLVLQEPITGITTTPTGRGYRLVARDGGVFDFGDAMFHGSLPARHVFVNDVVGMAMTPSGNGYWMARGSVGAFYAFGNAFLPPQYPPYPISAGDPVVAIFSNPRPQGWWLVTQSGAAIPFGSAPGGIRPSHRDQCTPANPPTMSLDEFQRIAYGMSYDQVSSLVGEQGTLVSIHSNDGIPFATYRWRGEGAPGAFADVYFDNDFEHTKAEHGLG